ncbi:MAG: glycosyltransferase N-terminal domain-containing protein [Saprospiraceae bacterium]
MSLLYPFFIRFYFFGIKIASLWRPDAKKWIEGRKDFFQKITAQKKLKNPDNRSVIWIHASSLGEFEQGRSLIEKIKDRHQDEIIWLSFFSPSAYDVRFDYPYADIISYFPSDNMEEVDQFISIVNPKLVVFVKYDFWFNTLDLLKRKSIPYYFISMHLSTNSYLRKPIFRSLLNKLKFAKKLFLQTRENNTFLQKNNFENIQTTGDTRLDRVLQIASEEYSLEIIEVFKANSKLLVLGSSWENDEKLLWETLQLSSTENWKIIIAPHLVDEDHLRQIEDLFSGLTCRYSEINTEKKILIIDRIGLLSKIYKYANLVYVGGGFGKGIHNTLEVVAHHVPVCFGPKYQKFPEAIQFIEGGFGFEINTSEDFNELLHKAEKQNLKSQLFDKIENWILENSGATELVYQEIMKSIN